VEDSLAIANRVMNVKVYWRQMRTYRFPLRMVGYFFDNWLLFIHFIIKFIKISFSQFQVFTNILQN